MKALLVAVALVLVAGIAHADSNGTVLHGCTKTKTGVLRMIDPGETCRANESPVEWGQVGPQGPEGKPAEGTVTGAYRQFGSFNPGAQYERPYHFACEDDEIVLSAMAYFVMNATEDGADRLPAVAAIWGNEILVDWLPYMDEIANKPEAVVSFDMWCAKVVG